MEQGLSRIGIKLTLLVLSSLLLTPLIGYGAALYFGMLDPEALFQARNYPLLLIYSAVVITAGVQMRRFMRPICNWIVKHPQQTGLPANLSERFSTFSTHYWAFFLLYVLLVPTVQHWLGVVSPQMTATLSLLQFMLLQLVIAVLVGMPGYFLALSLLGQLARYTGVDRIHISMQTRMLIIGAYVPLLTTAVLMKYFWWRTHSMPLEIIITGAALGALGITVTVLAIRSMNQGLKPLHQIIRNTGASTHNELAHLLRPRSHDEFGFLLQTLAKLFRRMGEQDATVHAIVDHSAEGIVVINAAGEIQLFNPAAETLFGYQSQEIHGRQLGWLLPELARDLDTPEQLVGKRELSYRHRNGETRMLQVFISPMQVDEESFYVCLASDITERKQAEQKLRETEARYRNLVETAHDLVWSMNPQGQWTYLNRAATTIYGLPPEVMVSQHVRMFQAPESAARDDEAFSKLIAGKELVNYETVHLDSLGRQHTISFNARPIFDAEGNVSSVTGTARDITEQKAYEQELTYQAEHDTLTGLYNRKYFHQELNRVIARVARSGADCALFYLDLDQFKYINDTLGHAAGDKLLQECTSMLKKHIREGDLLARFGGDEFTVLLYNVNPDQAMSAAENLRVLFEEFRFFHGEKYFSVTCTIGVSLINNSVESADEVLSHADLACNIAKSEGRNHVHLYSSKDTTKAGMAEDMGWAARVRDACDNDRFELLYQPIMSIADGTIQDYETLLRLRQDNGEFILPGGFMPAAERFGLIHNVDRWTVRNAIAKLGSLHDQGHAARFAINLSGRAMEDKELVSIIKNELNNYGVTPEALTFEITETEAIANLSAAVEFIRSLKDIGCEFALDDFGSGFCSFTYLKNLPVDTLKIDGSFVQGMARGQVDQAMVQSMAQVAHALGKKTIAEFVENRETLDILRSLQVDYAQGHFVGEPSDIILRPDTDISLAEDERRLLN